MRCILTTFYKLKRILYRKKKEKEAKCKKYNIKMIRLYDNDNE